MTKYEQWRRWRPMWKCQKNCILCPKMVAKTLEMITRTIFVLLEFGERKQSFEKAVGSEITHCKHNSQRNLTWKYCITSAHQWEPKQQTLVGFSQIWCFVFLIMSVPGKNIFP